MKRTANSLLILWVVLGLSRVALADVVNSAGAWQSWVAGDLDQNNSPFWDHTSWDGARKNIGYCLTGTGNCGMTGYPGLLPYLGMGSGANDYVNFTFTRSTPPSSNAALKIEIAGNSASNEFGWYNTSDGSLHPLFTGPMGAGAATVYVPSAQYGFYLKGPGGTFKSGVDGANFALFQRSSSVYWLGMEDLPYSNSDKDYNDMVVKITTNVPDGGATLMLLGGALIGIGTLRRRSRL